MAKERANMPKTRIKTAPKATARKATRSASISPSRKATRSASISPSRKATRSASISPPKAAAMPEAKTNTGTKTTPKPTARTAKAKAAKKTANPKKGPGRKRGALDEDDSAYDPGQSTDDILAEFDGRTRTKVDKLLIEAIRNLESGDDGAPVSTCADLLEREQQGEQLDWHYKLYWRFRRLWEALLQSKPPLYVDDAGHVLDTIEPRGSKSPSPRAKARAHGPARSVNQLSNPPDLSPSKASPSRATPSVRRAREPSRSPRRVEPASAPPRLKKPVTSAGRIQKPQSKPDTKYFRGMGPDEHANDVFEQVYNNAYQTERYGARQMKYNEAPSHMSRTAFRDAQLRGINAAREEEETLRTDADALEQQAIPQVDDPQVDDRDLVIHPATKRTSKKSPQSLLPGRVTLGKSSPTRPLSSPSSPTRHMAKTPGGARGTSTTPSPGKTRQQQTLRSSPAKAPYQRQYHENGQVQKGADKENRGTIVPPIQKDWVEVQDPKKKHGRGAQDRENPFFETMPGPEVWHRRMPPYFPFGETPYMEKVMSDQINEDLNRSHNEILKEKVSSAEAEEAPRSAGLMGSIASIPGQIASGISKAFSRSPSRENIQAAATAAPEEVRLPAVDFQDIVQPKRWPWHLPEFSEAQLEEEIRKARLHSSPPKRKRSATPPTQPTSPSKRRARR